MWNVPTEKRLSAIPRLYETESVPTAEKKVHLHFMLGNSDWYIIEFDGDDLFFGYAILNGDMDCAEWGYVSFQELKDVNIHGFEVDCESELSWTIKPVSAIKKIKF